MDILPATQDINDFTNKIWHCQAEELLAALPSDSVDFICVDPPYGFNKNAFVIERKNYSAIRQEWDNEAPLEWMNACTRILKKTGSVLCFGGRESIYAFANKGLSLGWRIVNDITFVKPDAPPNFTGRMMTESTERAIWFSPSGSHWTYNRQVAKSLNNGVNFRDVWEMITPKQNRLHPAQKPLETIELLIALLSNKDDIVLDCFSGSGTTALAAYKLGRRYIACDSHLPYVELSRQRLTNADPFQNSILKTGEKQLSLFASLDRSDK